MKLFTGIFIISCSLLSAFSTNTLPSKNAPTTAAPTTTPKNASTTAAPTTTPKNASTTAAPTTTHISTTIPPSTNRTCNSYIYTKADNTTCLMVKMTVYFDAPYGIINVTQSAKVDVANSSCSKLVVVFGKGNFQLTFNQTTDNKTYFLAEVDVTLNNDSESNSTYLPDFKTAMKSSYKCADGFNVTLGKIIMATTNVQLQAFEVDKNQFGTAVVCNDLSPIIPIVVGAVLGVLVLIVIVAYLIGRRRSRSGYEEI